VDTAMLNLGSEEDDSNFLTYDSSTIIQDYARTLAREGRFEEALSVLVHSAQQSGIDNKVVSEIGGVMINRYISILRKHKRGMSIDPWSCSACAGVLVEPVTLNCGHSSCKKCLLKDIKELCKKCGVKYSVKEDDPINDAEYVKTSIIVSDLVKKFWSKELSAVDLRNEGNKLFKRDEVKAAIQMYTEAFQLSDKDHMITSNRSHAYHRIGNYTAALQDAEKTIELRPDWGKGYFRKGMALKALGKPDQALTAFFECLLFEETNASQLKADICQAFSKFIHFVLENTDAPSSKRNIKDALIDIVSTSLSSEHGHVTSSKHISTSSLDRHTADGRLPSDGCKSPPVDTHPTPSLLSTKHKLEIGGGDVLRSGPNHKHHKSTTGDKKLLLPKNPLVYKVLSEIETKMEQLINMNHKSENRHIDPSAVDVNDYECALCFRLLWQPVTTSCGHTYCKSCLDRSLDHRNECPLCKTKIIVLNEPLGVNDFVDQTIRRMLPKEYLERQRIHEEDIAELGVARTDGRVEVAVFVCTMSFPNIPCPLHVFEPRYRLMIRRAMESGTREFGMTVHDPHKTFVDYGTMLEIRDIQYFNDGRSVVDTMGSRRFHVIERGSKDGYNTAVVEFLKDEQVEGEELADLKKIHDATRRLAVNWFNDMERALQVNVTSHYGPMPRLETEYWKLDSGPAWVWWLLAILPIEVLTQQQILSQTKLKKRLEAMGRIFGYLKRRGGMPA